MVPMIDDSRVFSSTACPAVLRTEGKPQAELGTYCHYRNCRHRHGQHGKSWTGQNGKQIQCKCKHFTPSADREFKARIFNREDPEFKCLIDVLNAVETYCDCGEPRRAYDVVQEFITSAEGKRELMTYHHCPGCKYDMAAWKIERRVTPEQKAELERKGIKMIWRQIGH